MDSRVKRVIWFGVSTLILLAMVYFADVGDLVRAVSAAELLVLVPALLLGFATNFVWSYTWFSFFKALELPISYFKTFKIFLAGRFLDNITPLGTFGGEPFMAYVISSNTDASYEKAFSTVFSADMVNVTPPFTFIVAGSVYLLFFGSLNEVILQTLLLALLATIGAGVVVYFLWFKTEKLEKVSVGAVRWISGHLGLGRKIVTAINGRIYRLRENFRKIGESPRHLLKTAVIAHLGFILEIVTIYLILMSLGVEVDFAPLYFVMPLAALANFSPMPGGSGAYEAALSGLLTFFFEVSFASALLAAILFRMAVYWPVIGVGYISLNLLQEERRG